MWMSRVGSGLAGSLGAFGPDLLPTPANADDDEFNGFDAIASMATACGHRPSWRTAAGATIVGPNVVRQSVTARTGWLLFQPDASAYYSKLLASALTTGLIYAKFSMDSNAGAGTNGFALLRAVGGWKSRCRQCGQCDALAKWWKQHMDDTRPAASRRYFNYRTHRLP